MLKVIIILIFFISCGDKENKDKSNSLIYRPITIDKNNVYATKYLIKPKDLKKDMLSTEINKTILKNQISTHLIIGNTCFIFEGNNNYSAYGIKSIKLNKVSANEYRPGLYHDELIPLNTSNCKNFEYALLELTESFKNQYLKFVITKSEKQFKNLMPIFIPLEPYAFNIGINKGKYINGEESLSIGPMDLLSKHNIQPIKNWLEPYNHEREYNFYNYVLKQQSSTYLNIPMLGEVNKIQTKDYTPWFYVFDEPTDNYIPTLKKDLIRLKRQYPHVQRMVTTHFRENLPIDIYCEVAQHITDDEVRILQENKKDLWMYISCMSHGCGPSRYFQNNPHTHIASPYEYLSGEPDLSIEASAFDIYVMYALGLKYPIKALLYYNSIEQWNLGKYGINPSTDIYNFGGNGDGTLIYPNYQNKSANPSLRLKLIREASYFFFLLKNHPEREKVIENIRSTTDWNMNYSELSLIMDL